MKFLFCLLYCGMLVVGVVGQPEPLDRTLFDAVERPNCEDLLVRLDGFALKVAYSPEDMSGQIVLLPGPNPIANAKLEKFLKRFISQKTLHDRVSVRNAKPGDAIRVELWVVTTVETADGKGHGPLTRDLSMIARPILFDSDLFQMYVDQEKTAFVGVDCAACCISTLDWSLLSEFLDANRELIPYVVIRGRRSRHSAIRAQLDRDMAEAGFRGSKVRFLFMNKNLVNSNDFSEVAVFMTPKIIKSARVSSC